MFKKTFLLITVLFTVKGFCATPQEEQQTNFRNNHSNIPAVITKTYKDPTNSTSTKDWNNKDWESQMQKNGVFDTGLIGNAQKNTESLGSNKIYNANPNELSTSALREDTSLDANKSLQGYSTEVEKSVFDGNNKRKTNTINLTQTTKCYIARELPIKFKCAKTGLSYGGSIDSGGAEAQKTCESECYEQFSCVNVSPPSNTATEVIMPNIILPNTTDSVSAQQSVTTSLKVDTLSMNVKINEQKVYIDIILVDTKNKDLIINKKLLLKDGEQIFKVGQFAKSVKINVYGDKTTSSADIQNIKITLKKEEKFICPTNQDISAKLPGEFAYLCPSGKIKTLTSLTGSYKICEDYGVVGDNSDGTFSSQTACNNSCKSSYSCAMDTTALSTNSLQNFREGCIEGQANCTLDVCKGLRLNKNQVVNENVFHGDFEPVPTVVNGALVKGAERPKIVFSEDLTFEERKKEEWKDGAYTNMINQGSYRYSEKQLNENTDESHAFNIGVLTNSINGTDAGNSAKSVYWVFKPKAFDVDSSVYSFYAVLEIIADSIRTDGYGNSYRERDKILYVKTTKDDFFKPFAIKRGFAKKASNSVEDAEVLAAKWEYQYFNTSSNYWIAHSSATRLEYFKQEKILVNGPFLRIPVISNYNSLMYNLPGLKRKIVKNGPSETVLYSGAFDGSGQAVTAVKMYIDYKDTSLLTYQSVVENIDNGTWKPIYDNSSMGSSPSAVTSDTKKESDSVKYHNSLNKNSSEDIEIFLYGKEDKKTAYTRIKPKTEDVGKKGFIYIFAQ